MQKLMATVYVDGQHVKTAPAEDLGDWLRDLHIEMVIKHQVLGIPLNGFYKYLNITYSMEADSGREE